MLLLQGGRAQGAGLPGQGHLPGAARGPASKKLGVTDAAGHNGPGREEVAVSGEVKGTGKKRTSSESHHDAVSTYVSIQI